MSVKLIVLIYCGFVFCCSQLQKRFVYVVLCVALLRDEVWWLDQLEKKLSRGPRPTCDAEELSEELDVCIIFMCCYFWSHLFYVCFCPVLQPHDDSIFNECFC